MDFHGYAEKIEPQFEKWFPHKKCVVYNVEVVSSAPAMKPIQLPTIAPVIKETIIDQRLKYLLTTSGNLTNSLDLLLTRRPEKSVSKHKIAALLEVLNRRNGIAHGRYTATKGTMIYFK